MAKQAMVAVHGMGQATSASFKTSIQQALQEALKQYEGYETEQIDEYVDIIPAAYNDIFDTYREAMAARGKSVAERLAAIPRSSNIAFETIERISGIEKEIADDDFFKTHFLDVIFYRFTVLGEPVRIRVGKAIAEAVANYNSTNVHVLAHSLGTSVVHDALTKLYGPTQFHDEKGQAMNLSATQHRLASIAMVSNVSRVLESDWARVAQSPVRPGALGITSEFTEFRHKLDPFTWVRPFNVNNNGVWISQDDWQKQVYALIEPSEVSAANTHDLVHYLKNPAVHLPLLAKLTRFKFRPKKAAREAAMAKYLATTGRGHAQALEEAFESIDLGELDSLRAFAKAAQAMHAFVSSFGEQL